MQKMDRLFDDVPDHPVVLTPIAGKPNTLANLVQRVVAGFHQPRNRLVDKFADC